MTGCHKLNEECIFLMKIAVKKKVPNFKIEIRNSYYNDMSVCFYASFFAVMLTAKL
jgi:hypothetical protein